MVHSLLQLPEIWSCHIWLVGRMKFASLEAKMDGGQTLLVYPILLFHSASLLKSLNMTEILLTGTYSLNSIENNFGLVMAVVSKF